jgi:hypothetical protein
MANVKISELPVATSVDVVDTVPLVQGGTTKQATQTTLLTTTGNVTAAKLVPTGGTATGNGMYLPATNALAWSTNGVEGMRLDASGNLGIGTSTPSKKLTVEIANTFDGTRVISNASSTDPGAAAVFEGIGARNDGNQTFFTRFAAAYRRSDGAAIPVDAGLGAVLFGGQWGTDTTYQSAKVLYPASIVGIAEGSFTSASAMPTGISFRTGSTGDNLYAPNLSYGIERARITSGGDLLVGTISNPFASKIVSVSTGSTEAATLKNDTYNFNTVVVWNAATSNDNQFVQFGTEASYSVKGSITYNRAGGLVAYNTTSDYRAKDILGPVANPGATIDALKVYIGKMKGAAVERPMLVAHEAQEVAPYAVTGQKDEVNEDGTPKYQQMDASVLVPLLIAEIQSLRARVAALEA